MSRVLNPWEETFSARELARARSIYRDGEVRALELTDELAIFHGGRARDDIYAVVEWRNPGFDVRYSIPDKEEGRALAAAGMYELEELLADEADPLPPENLPERDDARELVQRPPERRKRESEPPPRALRLKLSSTPRGLRLEGLWVAPDGSSENAFSGRAVTAAEREALIRLTTRAHHQHFVPRPAEEDYVLKEPRQIALFVSQELPRWERFFEITTDARVRLLGRGVRTVRLSLRLDAERGGFRYRWEGRERGELLEEDEILALVRNPRQIALSPQRGLIQLDDETARRVADWTPLFEHAHDGVLPRYMYFSFLGQDSIAIEAEAELEKWREIVEAAEREEAWPTPDFLRGYQRSGVLWLERLLRVGCHPLLADEMGLGKTVQMLALMTMDGVEWKQSSIIVCPASVVPVWQEEAAKFFPRLRVRVLRREENWLEDTSPTLWVASYTQLRRNRKLLESIEFRHAVLDEAQMIKNPEAKVTQACQAIRAERRVALTGTPLENRHLDLWTIFRFLMPGFLGSRRRFEDSLVNYGEHEVGKLLRRQLIPFILRRTKADVAKELPEKVEMTLSCPLTEVQKSEYERLVAHGREAFGNDVAQAIRTRAIPFFSLLTRLRQVSCDPGLLPWRRDDPLQSGKIVALVERLEEIVDSGQKVVIFSQFVRLLDRLGEVLNDRFANTPRFELTGKTRDRAAPVASFQNTEGAAIMLVSLKAGGSGITLNAAEYVFLLDPWWNPAVEAQAIDRVHRIGQTRQVFVYRLVTRGTIEARIEALKQHKRELFDQLVDGLDVSANWPTQFAQLSDLVAIRDEATDLDDPDDEAIA